MSNIKQSLIASVITTAFLSPSYAETTTQGEYSKDELDSCGTLLCLAGGSGYSECKPYLDRYYSIDKKKNRKKFLKKCPISNTTHNPGEIEVELGVIVRYEALCNPVAVVNYLNGKIIACEERSLVTGEICEPSGEEWRICEAFYSSSYVSYSPPKLTKQCKPDPANPGAEICSYRWVLSPGGVASLPDPN